jgi:hypothetical protein
MSDNSETPLEQVNEAATNEPGGSGKRKVLGEVIPTNRLTLAKQVEIIRAYGAAFDTSKGPVGIEDVVKFVGMAAATVSQTNAFLQEVGLIRKDGRRFIPASEVMAMNRLYDVSKERALSKMAPLFEKSWFGAIVIPKLKFRPMAEEDLVHQLFDAATAETQHLQQIRMLIDYLVLVGLVERDGANLKIKNGGPEDAPVPATPAAVAPAPTAPQAEAPSTSNEPPPAVLLLNADGSRRVTIKAPPTITKAELTRLRNWLEFQLIVVEDAPATGGETP